MNSITQPGLDRGRPDAARPDRARQDRVRCRVAPSALALLESARQGLASAENDPSAGGRYVGAHLAALRAAAAIVAARAEPAPPRRRRRRASGRCCRGSSRR